MKPKKFSLNKVSNQLKKPWAPITIAKVDDYTLNIAKFENGYHWHKHDKDELFIVLKVNENEGIVIPKNVEHCPVAIKSSIVLMFEDSKLK